MINQINFVPGDTVRVHERIKEGDSSTGHSTVSPSTVSSGLPNRSDRIGSGQVKTRIQVFEGTVLALKGRGENKSFTVMKAVGDIGVEKIWPVKSVNLEKVEVIGRSKKKIRRAKLYYMRLPSV